MKSSVSRERSRTDGQLESLRVGLSGLNTQSEKLKFFRGFAFLSQEELSDIIRPNLRKSAKPVSARTISNWETDRKQPLETSKKGYGDSLLRWMVQKGWGHEKALEPIAMLVFPRAPSLESPRGSPPIKEPKKKGSATLEESPNPSEGQDSSLNDSPPLQTSLSLRNLILGHHMTVVSNAMSLQDASSQLLSSLPARIEGFEKSHVRDILVPVWAWSQLALYRKSVLNNMLRKIEDASDETEEDGDRAMLSLERLYEENDGCLETMKAIRTRLAQLWVPNFDLGEVDLLERLVLGPNDPEDNLL